MRRPPGREDAVRIQKELTAVVFAFQDSRRTPWFPLVALVVALAGAASPAGAALGGRRTPGVDNPALAAGGQDYLPGVVLLKLVRPLVSDPVQGTAATRLTLDAEDLNALCVQHGVTRVARVTPRLTAPRKPGGTDLSRWVTVRYTSGADARAVSRAFAASAAVEYAEPQFVYPLAALANDPLYAAEQSAYFDRMQLPAAHDQTRGDAGDVVIAIVDGGSEWQHPDLAANVWTNPGETLNGLDDDDNGFVDDVHGWNFANGTNDPTGLPQTPSSRGHGTHFAGIAAAVSDNGVGVAGATWNAHFMPVCVAHPSIDNAIAFGYQGILYAVASGADVINCSWGGQGNPSYFEREVIEYARDQGVVVVAAAGNNGASADFYPATYPHVLAVANVNNSDQKVASSNYGTWVDVAAQGTGIHSTYTGGGYWDLSGTSMASPHVAAVCALVKTKWPAFLPEQVRERVRVTCDNIDAINVGFAGQLGRGRINANQALTKVTPAIRIRAVQVDTPDGDAIIEPGETVGVHVTVINYLDAATNVQFTLGENSSYANVPVNGAVVANLGTLEETVVDFSVRFTAAAPVNHLATCTLGITSGSPAYSDTDRFELRVLPIIVTHDANRVVTTVTSVGKLGFGEKAGGTGKDGVGFLYAGSPNLLFEGALLIGTGAATLSDAARGLDPNVTEDDFVTATNGTPMLSEAHPVYDQFATAGFTDAGATTPLGLHVRQDSWEIAAAPYDGFIVLRYAITNQNAQTLQGVRVGWFFDWDLDGATYATNRTGFDASRGLGYAWDDGNGPAAYVGISTLTSPGTTSYRGIWNDEAHASNPAWGVYDGFTDVEKWEALSGGIVYPEAGPADISHCLATGPFTIAPGDSVVVAFALIGGSTLVELQQNADVAQSAWDHPVDASPAPPPHRLWLAQNVPNPFNPTTTITFALPATASVDLDVFATSGKRVRTLLHGSRPPGTHHLVWDGRDSSGRRVPSGTYFYRLTVDGQHITRKMLLLK